MGTLQPAGETISSANIESRASSFKIDDVDINSKLSAQEKSQLEQLLMDYQDVFAANTKKPQQTPLVKHRIITNDALPVNRKQHRVPVAWQDELKQQVSEMLSNGIIRPSASPWNAPVLLVKKKDNSIRFVCDFRGVNDVTKRDTYPLPHIKDVIDKMAGARYWSTLDAASAYWSIPLVESDKEKTAFSSPNGKFEFNVMPFGLSNAGASYQRMMDMCLAGLPSDRTLAYMDDIVVFNSTFEQHIQDLATVFDRLRSAKQKDPRGKFARWIAELEEYDYTVQYIRGAKVWLKVKYYKTGENRKLAPRRRGPWTVLQKLPNGVNFKIENDQTKETKTVHHDRLTPVAMDKNTDRPVQDVMFHDRSFRQDDILDRFASKTNDSESDEERVYTSSDEDYTTDTDNEEFHDDNERPYRRYNLRERRARHFPENIPWTAIQL
eukprot:gene11292-biopygen11554